MFFSNNFCIPQIIRNFASQNNILMRHLKYLLTAIVLCLSAGMAHADILGKGVSLKLAEQRAAQLSGIEYDLKFTIPADRRRLVRGHAAISFWWNGEGDVVLDFQGERNQFDGRCTIFTKKNPNKKKEKQIASFAAFTNEHIIIQKEFLNVGVRNTVHLDFWSSNKSLNRNDDYLYTLFVPDHARSVFPCFDQPDLKATFKLTLDIPDGWRAISNGAELSQVTTDGRTTIEFEQSDLLPTYLFSFTAGRFQSTTATCNGRQVEALYRETDPQKVAQLQTVFDEVALSLRWLEDYTGIPYPFKKYGFVVLPGYQFGGMEHPGAIQFNDKRIFLGEHPTPDEELNRLELIAHETSHMWFGDLVTMRWFNDVWTKEVFANFMAAKISRERFPNINHDLNFLKAYQTPAMKTDRTLGTHPIQQPLANLNGAGLLYGNIIYDKAPTMMKKLEEQMGAIALQNGLRKYLYNYSYSNATWDDLICILDSVKPEAMLKEFSHVWVKEKGMPDIVVEASDHHITLTQKDPYGRGLRWPQKFTLVAGNEMERNRLWTVDMTERTVTIPVKQHPTMLIPNYNGSGYGRFIISREYVHELTKRLLSTTNDLTRYAIALTLYENYLNGVHDKDYFTELFRTLKKEKNPLIAATLCSHMHQFTIDQEPTLRQRLEGFMLDIAKGSPIASCRQSMTRLLAADAISAEVLDHLYSTWQTSNDPLLSERDYINMAYHLAIMRPAEWRHIISTQRARLKSKDMIREFDFVSRACNPSLSTQRSLFRSLLLKENRTVEPWAQNLLALLSCQAREPQNNEFITPGLMALEEIQRTGDIFFPANWLNALLGAHKSKEAKALVNDFIDSHPDYPQALKNKILEAAYEVFRTKD